MRRAACPLGVLLAGLVAAGLPGPLAAQVQCRDAPATDGVAAIVDRLERIAATPPVWDDFAPGDKPVILALDTTLFVGTGDTPACTLVWHVGAPLRVVELTALPALSTPLYGFVSLEPAGPKAQGAADALLAASRRITPGDQARLRSAGAIRAAVLPVPLDLAKLGRFGEMLKQANVDPLLIQAELTVHEGFHLHVQFPAWFDQPRRHAWPAWDLQPDRREMRETCYAGTPEVAAAFSREVDALLAGFDALYGVGAAPDPEAARSASGRFIDLRRARYALLDTVRVSQGGRRIGCPVAEAHLELEEGTAQWVGHATLVNAGIRRMDGLRGSYAAAQPDAFYRTGPLQLWILDGLFGREATHRLTEALARAPGPERGLFTEFVTRVR